MLSVECCCLCSVRLCAQKSVLVGCAGLGGGGTMKLVMRRWTWAWAAAKLCTGLQILFQTARQMGSMGALGTSLGHE